MADANTTKTARAATAQGLSAPTRELANQNILQGQAIDDAYTRIMKLHAILLHTYGESGDSFRNLNDDTQDAYMWSVCDQAAELMAVLGAACNIGAANGNIRHLSHMGA